MVSADDCLNCTDTNYLHKKKKSKADKAIAGCIKLQLYVATRHFDHYLTKIVGFSCAFSSFLHDYKYIFFLLKKDPHFKKSNCAIDHIGPGGFGGGQF